MTQPDLFDARVGCPVDKLDLTPGEAFEVWKTMPGAEHVLRACYRWASYYAPDWFRFHRKVSAKLIWEQVRRHVALGRLRAKGRGVKVSKWKGYSLNNTHTAYMARHIESHRPEWAGMFEKRETEERVG